MARILSIYINGTLMMLMKVMKVEVPKDTFNKLTNSEQKALYDLKNDKSIVLKSADKGSVGIL